MSPTTAPWMERYAALGRAQARYLWMLLAFAIFFISLDVQVRATHFPLVLDRSRFAPEPNVVPVPFVPIPLSAEVVRLFGPLILFVILRATLGTLGAAKTALEKISGGIVDAETEAYDTHPNVIDMSVYHRGFPSRFVYALASASYPLYLVVHMVVACSLWYLIVLNAPDPTSVPQSLVWIAHIFTVGFAVATAIGLSGFGRTRARKVRAYWNRFKDPSKSA